MLADLQAVAATLSGATRIELPSQSGVRRSAPANGRDEPGGARQAISAAPDRRWSVCRRIAGGRRWRFGDRGKRRTATRRLIRAVSRRIPTTPRRRELGPQPLMQRDRVRHLQHPPRLSRESPRARSCYGISTPFNGPSRELGRGMQVGLETYFDDVNQRGGVAGRKIRLVALDDGYEPDRALANMKELIDQQHVFAVIGNVGTPTAEKALPYALEKQVPFFGDFTGAKLLRKDPPDRFVFNYRASYEEETAAIVKYFLEIKKIRPEQIAVFAQQDGYGDAGYAGVVKMLRKAGGDTDKLLRVGYARNTSDVAAAVEKIGATHDLRAVVMVATYRPAARFIQLVKDAGQNLLFANVSFVGSDALADELTQLGPKYSDGIIVTQVVPNPNSQASAVLKYRELLAKYHPNEKPGFVSLEGYIDAMIFAHALEMAGGSLTTDSLVAALESIHNLDLGIGAPLNFGPSEHQAAHKVWGTILDSKGQYQILDLE